MVGRPESVAKRVLLYHTGQDDYKGAPMAPGSRGPASTAFHEAPARALLPGFDIALSAK